MTDPIIDSLKNAAETLLAQEKEQEKHLEALLRKFTNSLHICIVPESTDDYKNLKDKIEELEEELNKIKKAREECVRKLQDLQTELDKVLEKQRDVDGIIGKLETMY